MTVLYHDISVRDPKAYASKLMNKIFMKGYKSKVIFNEQKKAYVVLILRNGKWSIVANIKHKANNRKFKPKKSKPKSLYGW